MTDDTVFVMDPVYAETSANPFLSSLSSFGANIFTTAGGLLSKATDTAIDAASVGLSQRIIGSISPTGSSSPDAAASRSATAAAQASTGYTLPGWTVVAAGVVGAALIAALVLRNSRD